MLTHKSFQLTANLFLHEYWLSVFITACKTLVSCILDKIHCAVKLKKITSLAVRLMYLQNNWIRWEHLKVINSFGAIFLDFLHAGLPLHVYSISQEYYTHLPVHLCYWQVTSRRNAKTRGLIEHWFDLHLLYILRAYWCLFEMFYLFKTFYTYRVVTNKSHNQYCATWRRT